MVWIYIVFCFWLHSQVWYVDSHLFSLLGQGLYYYGWLFSLLSQVWYEYSDLFCITLFFFAAEAGMNIVLVLLLLLGQVRKRAQHTLQQCFTYFHYTYHKFVPPLVMHLKNPQVEEHTFKVRCCWVQGTCTLTGTRWPGPIYAQLCTRL